MRAILLIDHGSVRAEANHMLACVANLLQSMVGESVIVRFAHMELAEPSIAAGVQACAAAGATELTVFPYMLSPGKHSTADIPRMIADAARAYPRMAVQVTAAFGVHAKLAEVIAERAGVPVRAAPAVPDHECWSAEGVGACGGACTARLAADAVGVSGS